MVKQHAWRFLLGRFDDPKPDPKPDPAPDPKPDPAPDPNDPKPDPKDPPKTFTQDELDRIISDRLKRQKEQFADYDDAKAKAAKFDELEEANKTELEKAQAAAAKAEEDKTAALATANERLIKGETKGLAGALGFLDPDDAFALMDRSEVKVDDGGNVVGVKESLAKLVEAKPHLVASKRPTGGADGGAGGDDVKDFRSASKEVADAEMAKHGIRPRTF